MFASRRLRGWAGRDPGSGHVSDDHRHDHGRHDGQAVRGQQQHSEQHRRQRQGEHHHTQGADAHRDTSYQRHPGR